MTISFDDDTVYLINYLFACTASLDTRPVEGSGGQHLLQNEPERAGRMTLP